MRKHSLFFTLFFAISLFLLGISIYGSKFVYNPFSEVLTVHVYADEDDLYSDKKGILVPGDIAKDSLKTLYEYYDITKNEKEKEYYEYLIGLAENGFGSANYSEIGPAWIRDAEICISSNQLEKWQSPGTIRVSGHTSRRFSQKSLKFKSDTEFQNIFNYPTDNIKIYNSGSDNGLAYFRNPYAMHLAQEANLIAPDMRPCETYINNKYYGFMWLAQSEKERARNSYGLNKLNSRFCYIDRQANLVFYDEELNYISRLDEALSHSVIPSNSKVYDWDNIKNDITNGTCPVDIINDYIDVQEYIRYMAFKYCIGDYDFEDENDLFIAYINDDYKPSGIYDGRLYPVMKDLDRSLSDSMLYQYVYNTEGKLRIDRFISLSPVFNCIMKDPEYRNIFKEYCYYYLDNCLSEENMLNELDSISKLIEPYIIKTLNEPSLTEFTIRQENHYLEYWRTGDKLIPDYNSWLFEINDIQNFINSNRKIISDELKYLDEYYQNPPN